MKEANALRSSILELLYKGESETAILNEIVKRAQNISQGSICSILCVDEEGKHLLLETAPDLPDFYNKAVNGLPIRNGMGSCGTAAFTGERVIVEDINTHPYWSDFKSIAKDANLGSCWSEPIKDASGKVLGTFAIYHRTPNIPNTKDVELISELSDLTAIVLDRGKIIRQLAESESKYKTLADASNEAVFIVDKDIIVEINTRAEIMTGYSELELSGVSIFSFIEKEYWIVSLDEKSRDFRHRIQAIGTKKDGSKIDVVVRIKNSTFKGKVICLLSIRDVTNYKNTKTELLKLSQSVIQSPVSVVITNCEGNIEYVNPKFNELTGYSLEEVIGENPRILSSKNNKAELYKSMWEEIKSGNEWRGEFQNKKKNGELFWEFATISPIKDDRGQIINFIAVKEDITERKRQEQIQKIILNISNAVFSQNTLFEFIQFIREELSSIIDTTNFFVALYDDETEMFSLPFHDDEHDSFEKFPKDKTVSGWVVDHETALLATAEELDELEAKGEVELKGEPSKIWLGMPLKGKEKVIGILVIQSYEDENAVTKEDKKMLELVSHQISISIEQKRTEQELYKALRDATESDRLKSVFLATMSHELRTPLNAVIGFSGLVDNETGIETAIEYCKMINQSGHNLLNIVEDLFDISLIQSGAVKIKHEDYSILNLFYEIDAVIHVERNVLEKEHIELILNIPPNFSDFVLNTDPHRFKQIFLNLLKNALKFTDKGSIEYGFQDCNPNSKEVLQFFVKDTGIGIPEEVQESIFGLFRQANEELSRKYNGVGIGLSISKSLIELLGGKIWFDSTPEEGSTFYFTHPVK
ncbi:PAS domain S-box protein [Labilibaculum sp. K2S]|uniref:sensor histidine kinase n=1 Tax=Labilibaculum sp. K2S TaxID=3056386 RepID=UPI0025A37779|nr:PAS domain S-box protein [Labilibaculum sp. K2S]MDM8160675.1 PAS domain S-box protein [Labilibaculum sp. K2S]